MDSIREEATIKLALGSTQAGDAKGAASRKLPSLNIASQFNKRN